MYSFFDILFYFIESVSMPYAFVGTTKIDSFVCKYNYNVSFKSAKVIHNYNNITNTE